MNKFLRFSGLTLMLFVVSLAFAFAASAQSIDHGSLSGTDVEFNSILETIVSADDNPGSSDPLDSLYGAPSVFGNSLAFINTSYVAQGVNGGYDNTHAKLNFEIDSRTDGDGSDTDIITWISLTENGDTNLSEIGGTGTAATGVSMAVSGVITILETASDGAVFTPINFIAQVTPTSPLDFTTNPGVGSWTATLGFDVTQYYPDATKVIVSLNNDLWAFSETGTQATISKKVAGISIDVVPEPSTALLVGGGLLMMGLRGRKQRA